MCLEPVFCRRLHLLTENGEVEVDAKIEYFVRGVPVTENTADDVDKMTVTVQYKGVKYTGIGTAYPFIDAVADLQKKLPAGVEIQVCAACRHGNMCPVGDSLNELFCTKDVRINEESDLHYYTENSAEAARRSREYTDVCSDFGPQSDDFFTYSDYMYCFEGGGEELTEKYTSNDRYKRIAAFLIDWYITVVFFVILMLLFMEIFKSVSDIPAIIGFSIMLSPFVLFILRDIVFKGNSLGKKIFRLRVLDANSLEEAAPKRKVLKNLFFFIFPIEAVFLLFAGRTIGEMTTRTVVIAEGNIEKYRKFSNNGVSLRKKALTAIMVVFVGFLCLVGIVLILLGSQKDTEEYKEAYSYLIESEAFEALDADESDIFMNRYSSNNFSYGDHEDYSYTVTIGFIVKWRSLEVVCHNKDGIWQVCESCTEFE